MTSQDKPIASPDDFIIPEGGTIMDGDLSVLGHLKSLYSQLRRIERVMEKICLTLALESSDPGVKSWAETHMTHVRDSVFDMPSIWKRPAPNEKSPEKAENS